MTLDDATDGLIFILSLLAVGVGVGCELSAAWAGVTVGSILVVAVLAERFTLRFVGKAKRKETAADEPA